MGKSSYEVNKHLRAGSHLPVLSKLLERTQGAVLELGCGYYSTPLLYWHCKAYDRPFESYENDKKWAEQFKDMGTKYVKDWDKFTPKLEYYSIIFIDHRPALDRHRKAIEYKDRSSYVILHDTEPEIDKFYAYRRVWNHYRWVYHFNNVMPNTSVVSNNINLDSLFDY